jgi:hypothetical protein
MKRIPPKEKIDQIQTKRQNTRTEGVEVVELSTNAIKFDHRLAAEEAWKQGNKQKAAYHRHMLAEEAWKQENYSEVPKEFLNGLICRPAFPSCISFLSISDKPWVETWYTTYCKEVQRIFVLWGNKAYLEKLAEKEAHR